jgi:hypothetical protein
MGSGLFHAPMLGAKAVLMKVPRGRPMPAGCWVTTPVLESSLNS